MMCESAVKTWLPLIVAIALLLNPVLVSYGSLQEKEYKLFADGYIQGRAKITCWEYGDGSKIHVKIDVTKALHMKGNNLMSAFIVDVTKNGIDSYIEIGHPVVPHEKSDYIAFAGFFDSSNFPSTMDNDSCPIGDVGRIVVVVGTSPPSDDDTVTEGDVDVIASSTPGTSEMGVL